MNLSATMAEARPGSVKQHDWYEYEIDNRPLERNIDATMDNIRQRHALEDECNELGSSHYQGEYRYQLHTVHWRLSTDGVGSRLLEHPQPARPRPVLCDPFLRRHCARAREHARVPVPRARCGAR